MSDLQLDVNEDLNFTGTDLTLVAGDDEIVQRVQMTIGIVKGEWYRNINTGVPYFQGVFVKNPDPELLESIFKNAILADPDIVSITEFDMNILPNRTLEVEFTAATLTGQISGSVPA